MAQEIAPNKAYYIEPVSLPGKCLEIAENPEFPNQHGYINPAGEKGEKAAFIFEPNGHDAYWLKNKATGAYITQLFHVYSDKQEGITVVPSTAHPQQQPKIEINFTPTGEGDAFRIHYYSLNFEVRDHSAGSLKTIELDRDYKDLSPEMSFKLIPAN